MNFTKGTPRSCTAKLGSSAHRRRPETKRAMSDWTPFARSAVAIFDFDPSDGGEYQVALRVDQRIEVQEESGGWYVNGGTLGLPVYGISPN
jgi:hypothetical protein